jgi:hypothetical protein
MLFYINQTISITVALPLHKVPYILYQCELQRSLNPPDLQTQSTFKLYAILNTTKARIEGSKAKTRLINSIIDTVGFLGSYLSFSKIFCLITSTSLTITSIFSFIFSDTIFVLRYSLLPKSSLKRRSSIYIQTWQFPAFADSFSRSKSFRAPSALHLVIYL